LQSASLVPLSLKNKIKIEPHVRTRLVGPAAKDHYRK
jgi:hypothetical protein